MTGAPLPSRPTLGGTVLYLDGLTGTGKTMMAPLLGSFERVEIGQFHHIHEYLGALEYLGRIQPDAVEFLLSLYGDLGLYNVLISREVNFRKADLSGVFQNPRAMQYFRRLFAPDGDVVVTRVANEKPVFHVVTHQALGVLGSAFQTFGERVRFVEMVRHPLYLLDHWESYIDRHGTDPRDFTVYLDHNGARLPWFTHGWEDRWVASSRLDRVIYSIDALTKLVDAKLGALSREQREQILFVPFEHFVLDPEPHLASIERLLRTKRTRATAKVLSKQRVPRHKVTAGPNKAIYRRYAWRPPKRSTSDLDDLESRWERPRREASIDAVSTLERLCEMYEKQYGLWF